MIQITHYGSVPSRRERFARLAAVVFAAFAAVTCGLVTAPDVDPANAFSFTYDGNPKLVIGNPVPLEVTIKQGGIDLEGARLQVTSSNTDVIEVVTASDFDHTLNPKSRGTAVLTVRLLGSTLGDTPPDTSFGVTAVASNVVVTQTNATLRSLGDTLTFSARVFDGTNAELPGEGSAVRWFSSNEAILRADSLSGKVTAVANGTATLRGILQVDAETTLATVVVQQQVAHYTFSPAPVVIGAIGGTATITSTPRDSGGSVVTGVTLPAITYASRRPGSITVNGAGLVTGLLNDTTFVVGTATVAGSTVTDSVRVEVGQVAQQVIISQSGPINKDAVNDTVNITAVALDARGVAVIGRPILFTSRNSTIARQTATTASGATFALDRTGAAIIAAQLDAAKDSITVDVSNVERSIRISAGVNLPTIGDSLSLVDSVFNRLGAYMPGVAVSWRTLDTTIATVHPTQGVLVGRGIGRTSVIAQISTGGADTTTVDVENRINVVDIVQPDTSLGSIGDTTTVRVDFRNTRGAQVPRSAATWHSTDSTVVSVSNGFLTALRQGFSAIYATDPLNPARTDSLRVTVTNAAAALSLNRSLDTLTAPSRTLQYSADVRNARGAQIANALVSFRSINGSIASITAGGLATALAVGSTSIIGEVGTGADLRADTALLVVTNDAVGLTVSPTAITVASVGATVQLVADARNAVGGSVTGVSFTWTTSDPLVATVDGSGTVTGIGVGTATVQAQLAALTATANVTVTNAPDTINITPTTITIPSVGDAVVPPGTFRNALGAALPRTSAQWLSDDAGIVSVTSAGIVTAVGRGTTLVRARNALNTARQDSVSITVTDAPDSINVVRTADVLPSINRTIQYTADVFNARRSSLLTEPVTWTSRNAAIATVASSGLATSVGIGSTFIVGSAGLAGVGAGIIADSALLTVSNTAASVQLSPASITLASVGDAVTLTAVARNELGNLIVNPAATWLSANPAVAALSSAGPAEAVTVTAASVGSTTISATVDGVTQTVNVAVTNPPTTLQITSGNLTLASIGDQVTPSVDFRNSLNAVLPRDAALWSTSDVNVATVSSTGVVTAIGAGTVTITATSPASGALFSSVTATVTNAPNGLISVSPAGTSTLTALGQTVSFTATVRNAAGAIIASPSPAVTWGSNNAAVTVDLTTGIATAVANTAGATITATAGAASGTATVAVAQAASAARSIITASATSLTANGAATSTITVRLRDANGVDLTSGGGTVTMALTGTGSLGGVTDNGDGTYAATLTAPTSLGSGSVSGSIGASTITTGDPLVTWVAGPATRYIVTSSSTSPVVGSPVTVTAQQADAFNNPVTTARTVTWSSTAGGSFGAPLSLTNTSGVATVTFTTSATAGASHNVTATDNVAVTGTSATIQTIAGAADRYLVTASAATAAAGTGVTITAQLADASSNPVSLAGRIVTWSRTGIGGSFATATSLTNGAGMATVVFTVHTLAGTVHTVTGTDNTALIGTTGTITALPGVASAATTLIAAGAGAVTSGNGTTITVTARDANGNPLSGSGGFVALATTRGILGAVTDNGDGTYTASFTGTSVGTATISGTLAGSAMTSTANVTVNTGPASLITIDGGDGQSAFAGANVAVPPSVLVRDANGNPVGGATVTFTITGGAGTISPASPADVLTNSSGIAALAFWTLGAAPGPNTVSADQALAGTVSFTATANAGPASTATSLISAGAASFTAGGNTSLTVQLRDAAGNALGVSGGSVTLATTLGSLSSVSDNADGTYTATLSSAASGTATVTGTVNGAAIADNAVVGVDIGAASAAQSAATVPTGTAGSQTSITVQARDAFGNNRTSTSGAVLASVTGANTVSAGVADNADGTYTVTYTPASTGADAIAITLGGSPIGGSPYTSVVVAGAPAAAQSTATVPAGSSGAVTTLTVRARDALGNNRTSSSGTVVVGVTGANTATPAVTDNLNGTYTATYTPVSAGTDIIAITLGGVAIGGSPYSSVVSAGGVASFLVEATGGGAIGTQTAGTPFSIRITARDASNNTATGFTGTVVVSSNRAGTTGLTTTAAFTAGVLSSHSVTLTQVGAASTITATRSGGSETGTSAGFTMNPGAVDHFLVEAQGGGAIGTQTAGTPFDLRITAQDLNNNTVTSFTGTVDVTSNRTGSAGLVTSAAFTAGVLTSHAVTLTQAGAGSTITATRTTGGSEAGTSASFTVNPAALDDFLVEAQGGGAIATQTAGSSFSVRVTARDVHGNTVTSFTGAGNTVDITSNRTGSAGLATTATFTAGVLITHAVTLTEAGAGSTITATRTSGTESGTSATFTVDAAALNNFLVEAQGSGAIATQTAGSSFSIQVTARDIHGNTVTSFTGAGSAVDITSNRTGSAGLTTTADFTAGVLVSHAVTLTEAGAGSTITATRTTGGTESGTSAAFTVDPGALDNFLVEAAGGGPIGTQASGVAFDIQVTARDAFGNVATQFDGAGNTVDISLDNVTGTGTLSAGIGTTAGFVNGVLATHSVTITVTAGGTFSITAARSAGGSETGTSNTFTAN